MLESLQSFGHPVSIEIILLFYLGRYAIGAWIKPNLTTHSKIEEQIADSVKNRCAEIGKSFNADKVFYWAIANGEKFNSGWDKKKLVGIAEYTNPNKNIPELQPIVQEISTLYFGRNVKALVESASFRDSGIDGKIKKNLGKEGADIHIMPSMIFVEDEARFEDTVAETNIKHGFRSLVAGYCTNRNGNEKGILVLGWDEPKKISEVNLELFYAQCRSIHGLINKTIFNNNIKSWFYYMVYKKIFK